MTAEQAVPVRTVSGQYRALFVDGMAEYMRLYAHGRTLPWSKDRDGSPGWLGMPAGKRVHHLTAMPFEPDAAALARIDAMRASISASIPAPRDRRRRPRWSEEAGDDICIDRLRSGMPPWRETVRQVTTGPTHITIVSNLGAHCGVEAEGLGWTPAASLLLADLLESNGYRVRLLAVESALRAFSTDPENILLGLRVKDYGEPMSIQGLSVTATPWFFRGITLAVHDAMGRPQGGYGCTRPVTAAQVEEVIGEPGATVHVMRKPDYHNQAEAVEIAREALRAIFPGQDVT